MNKELLEQEIEKFLEKYKRDHDLFVAGRHEISEYIRDAFTRLYLQGRTDERSDCKKLVEAEIEVYGKVLENADTRLQKGELLPDEDEVMIRDTIQACVEICEPLERIAARLAITPSPRNNLLT